MAYVKGKENQSFGLWRLFHEKLVGLGIEPEQAGWMVKWAEGFAKSMKGPLVSRSANDVLRYLENLAGQAHILDWQLKQAVQALQHLYQDQLDRDWARKWQWDKAEAHVLACLEKRDRVTPSKERSLPPASRKQNSPPQNEQPPADGFLDQVSDPALKTEHANLLGKLRAEIRRRHGPALGSDQTNYLNLR